MKFPTIRRHILLPITLILLISLIFQSCGSCGTWIRGEIPTSKVINAKPIPSFTIPPKNPHQHYVQFIAVGDMGTGGSGQQDVAQAMARKASNDSISFVLVLGDNFYESGVTSINDEQWQIKFEKMYWQPSLQVPFYAVLGNHDYRSNPQAQVEYTTVSTRWKMPARYYTFSYPTGDTTNVQFFCLDTQPLASLDMKEAQSPPEQSTTTQQLRWLEHELSVSTARWKIALGHHTMYSGGEHGDNRELAYLLEPLFVQYKVDLYLCGHDHDQELLKPIKGVYYILSGAGGKHRDVTWRDNTVYAATNLGFVWFRISQKEILVEFLDRQGKLDYAHVITKQ